MIVEETNETNFGPSDVAVKIKNLRTAYPVCKACKEKYRIDSKKSGSGARPIVFWRRLKQSIHFYIFLSNDLHKYIPLQSSDCLPFALEI